MGQSARKVLRDQTKPECRGCGAVQPNRRRRCFERRHSLGEQRCDEASQDVAASARRKLRGRVGIDDRASVRGCDDGIGAFQQNDRVALLRGVAGTLQLVALKMEDALEFTCVLSFWRTRGSASGKS